MKSRRSRGRKRRGCKRRKNEVTRYRLSMIKNK